jgi:hypothetical protein
MFRQRPRGRTVHRADSRKSAHDAHFDPTNGVGIENRGFFNGLLAVFKPTKIRGFIWEDEERDWDADKVAQMREQSRQIEIFADDRWRETFQLIPKLPYSFSYQLEDAVGRKSTLQILDWECGQLYWNCWRRGAGDETEALEKVRAKYMDEFGRRDVHLLLGTTQQFHGFAPNPWVIVGVFAPPMVNQTELDLGV